MKRMLIAPAAAMLCLTIAGFAAISLHADPASPKSLTAMDRQGLLNDKFKTSYSSSAIPPPVMAIYTAPLDGEKPASGKPKFPMAEPGKPWNNTDAIHDATLPFRRLIFVAVSYDTCVVAYERGGIAYSRNITLFHLKGKKAEQVWSGNIFGELKTLSDLRAAIKNNKYRDGGWQ